MNEKKIKEEELSPEKKLAIYLHEKFCCANHTDGYGWYYEEGSYYPVSSWEGHDHARYLNEATVLIDFLQESDFMEYLNKVI